MRSYPALSKYHFPKTEVRAIVLIGSSEGMTARETAEAQRCARFISLFRSVKRGGFLYPWNRRNPLKSPVSDEENQGIPRTFCLA
jgi:hypothetical protein